MRTKKADSAEPTVRRTHFATPRALEFFSKKELTAQIGHDFSIWPVATLREVIDNSLDACEDMGTRPNIRVTVEADAVSVEDNGPGLPTMVLERSLDYTVRISDKALYASPSRGQQGYGLKGLWAAPFVADGKRGQVEVVTAGERHVIDVTLDRIGQKPVLRHTRSSADVKTGTYIKVHWPNVASYLDGDEGHGFYNVTNLLSAYATFNPHATFRLSSDADIAYPATDLDWQKWRPSRPTSPHWYTPERLTGLIVAHLAAERAGAKPTTVREFVAKFYGLAGTAKQKKVGAAAGLSNALLHDLMKGDDVDTVAVGRLLSAMQAASRPVKPRALGVLGEAHFAHELEVEWMCSPDSIRYKASTGVADGVPFVLEVAFGVHDEDVPRDREILAGVNWSPSLDSPFFELPSLLGHPRVDDEDPVTVVVHLAYPTPQFSDRGKGRLRLPQAIEDAIEACVRFVTKRWKEAKRSADRDGRLQQQQLDRLRKAERKNEYSLVEAANLVMEEAYLRASGNKADPANARQIMYAARPRVLELTGGKCWSKSSYFTQTLLPQFINSHPDLTADWDVVFDARGRIIEPHTGHRIDLGTVEVRRYINGFRPDVPDRPAAINVPIICPTYGPANRYRYVLFVEKEGFYHLLERRRIADRFDIAIMSTKGMSVTAARQLVDRLSEQGVTILVLRDFDKAGFSIVHTLRTDSLRYKFRSKPKVIDIGLRLTDVREWDLERLAEPVDYRKMKKDPRIGLRIAGATAEESDFLVEDSSDGRRWSGRRVELNAFTSPRLIEFLEYKFAEAGVHKVVPTGGALKAAFRRAWGNADLQEAIDQAVAAVGDAGIPAPPRGLASKLATKIAGTDMTWDEALATLVREQRARRPERNAR